MNKPIYMCDLSKEMQDFLVHNGTVTTDGYYNLPQWFFKLDGNTFQVLMPDELPEHVKRLIND